MSTVAFAEYHYPPEILDAICAQVFFAGLPPAETSLDPLIPTTTGVPTAQPSSSPPAYWSEPLVRRTLSNLCLASRAWNEAAKPWLWKR